MTRGQRTDPHALSAALAEGRRTGDWAAAAQAHGIAPSTLRAHRQRYERDEAAVTAKRAPKTRKARRSGSAPRKHGSAPRKRSARAKDADLSAELAELDGVVGAAVDFEQLDALVDDLRGRLERLPDHSPRLGPLASTISMAIARRAKLRPPPPPDPSELAAERRRADGEVVEMIERYVSEYEAQAIRDRVCLWCEQPLSPELAAKLHGDAAKLHDMRSKS